MTAKMAGIGLAMALLASSRVDPPPRYEVTYDPFSDGPFGFLNEPDPYRAPRQQTKRAPSGKDRSKVKAARKARHVSRGSK